MKWMSSALLATLVLAGCATTTRLTSQEQLQLHLAHAGEPVPSFRFFGSLHGWNELGDRAMVVHTRPNESWLLQFDATCPGLTHATTIGLSSQFDRVYARFDQVYVRDTIPSSCRISSIRPLDSKAIKAGQAQLRQAKIEQRQAEQAEDEQPAR